MKAKRWRETKYNASAALRRPRGELREMADLRRQRKEIPKIELQCKCLNVCTCLRVYSACLLVVLFSSWENLKLALKPIDQFTASFLWFASGRPWENEIGFENDYENIRNCE